jgi:hypothetical protein
MPTFLKDLDIDEVSLVGEPANNIRFLIAKSRAASPGGESVKNKVGDSMISDSEYVTKSDLQAFIRKAMEAEVQRFEREKEELRKALTAEIEARRTKELAAIAKSRYSVLGPVSEMVDVLKTLDGMPKAARKKIQTIIDQAAEIKKTSELFTEYGTRRPDVTTPAGQFEAEVSKKLDELRAAKPDANLDVLRAEATTWVVKNRPDLYASLRHGSLPVRR